MKQVIANVSASDADEANQHIGDSKTLCSSSLDRLRCNFSVEPRQSAPHPLATPQDPDPNRHGRNWLVLWAAAGSSAIELINQREFPSGPVDLGLEILVK